MQEGGLRLALATLLVAACAAGERLSSTDPRQNKQLKSHMRLLSEEAARDSSQVRQPTGHVPLLGEEGQIATLRPELLRQTAAAAASEAGLDRAAGFPSRNVAEPLALQVATLRLQLEPNQMQVTTSQTLGPNRMQLATSQTLEPNQMQVTTSETLEPNRMQLATAQTLEPNKMQPAYSRTLEPQGTASQALQAGSRDAGGRVPASVAVPSDNSGENDAVDGVDTLGESSGPVQGATSGAQNVPVQASAVGPDWSNVYPDPAGGLPYRSTDPDEAVLQVPVQIPPKTKTQGEQLSNLPADIPEASAALEKASGGLWMAAEARAAPVDANTFCRSVFPGYYVDVNNRACYYMCLLLLTGYSCCFNNQCFTTRLIIPSCEVRGSSLG
jgi:hypothetical protein